MFPIIVPSWFSFVVGASIAISVSVVGRKKQIPKWKQILAMVLLSIGTGLLIGLLKVEGILSP